MSQMENDKKLEAFSGAILSEAIAESSRITDELLKKQKQLLLSAEEEIASDTKRSVSRRIAEINARESRRVATRMSENKHTLLQYREDCAKEAFDEVSRRIIEFTQSPQYLPYLKALLQKSVDALGYGFSATVYLRSEDLQYVDELMSDVTGVSLAFKQGSFTLGGLSLVCQSRGRRVDMTFDSALGDLVGHFSELTGMSVGE